MLGGLKMGGGFMPMESQKMRLVWKRVQPYQMRGFVICYSYVQDAPIGKYFWQQQIVSNTWDSFGKEFKLDIFETLWCWTKSGWRLAGFDIGQELREEDWERI